MPGAVWIGPTANQTPGGMSDVIGVVLHIQEGSEAGTEAWQHNPQSQISSHFLAPKTGGLRQMVDTADKAWCEVAGNRHWLSVECEGRAGDQLTPGQLEACAQLLAWAHRQYQVPLRTTEAWAASVVTQGGLGWHGMGGNAWGGHFQCPGRPIVNQRGAIVARAQQITEAPVENLTPDEKKKLDDINFTTTQIPDPAHPGQRMPLHVAEYQVLLSLVTLQNALSALSTAVAAVQTTANQILAKLPAN